MIRGLHHINVLVRDLDEAASRYERLLGVQIERREGLPARGVRTARFRAGESWVVLVQPVADGEPMRQLQARGEGIFLLSFAVDDVRAAAGRVRAAGGGTTTLEPRAGLDGWQVIDVDGDLAGNSVVQLCQDDSREFQP